MKKKRSIVATIVASIFALAMIAPASASSTQTAASLNDLKATDSQLTAAVSTLNGQVLAQQAEVDAARQAVEAANQAVVGIQSGLDAMQQNLGVLEEAESQRAVELYMSPSNDDFVTHFLASSNLTDATERDELMTVLSGHDYNTLDALQAAQREYKKQQKQAFDAQRTANQRSTDAQAKLGSLNASLAAQSRLETALKVRINSYAAEDAASAQGPGNSDANRASRGADNSVDSSRQSSQGLTWPVHGSHQINSPYGQRWGRMHEGIDIQATSGQPIYAAKAGTVTFAGQESGYGGYVCIQHGGGFQTCYAHEVRLEVTPGQQVSQGQELGTAGASGDATGVNLHFETCSSTGKECFYGQFHNPVDYLP